MTLDSQKILAAALIILAMVSVSGCGSKKETEEADIAGNSLFSQDTVTTKENAPSEDAATAEEIPSEEKSEEEPDKESTPEEDPAFRELTKEELNNLEKDFNSIKYNGFLVQEFPSPDRIFWDEVFYLGAGIGNSIFDDRDLEEEFLKITGWEELETDVTYFDRKQAEDFMEETTELSPAEMKHPISFTYLKDRDVYANAHGDTNQMGVNILSGTAEDGIIKVRYDYDSYQEDGEELPEYELTLKEKDNGYIFISNLWSPPEGREKAIESIYNGIIEKYVKGISEGWGTEEFEDNNLCYLAGYLKDRSSYGDTRDPLDMAGFCFRDIDDDGIDELFIGEIPSPVMEEDNGLYEVYTIKSADWNRILRGGGRDRYYLSEDGTFYNEASDSAFNYTFIHYAAEGPYKFLEPIDGVIYDSNNKDLHPDNGSWFYSKDSFWDTAEAEPISEKEFNDYYSKAEASYVRLEYTPFGAKRR